MKKIVILFLISICLFGCTSNGLDQRQLSNDLSSQIKEQDEVNNKVITNSKIQSVLIAKVKGNNDLLIDNQDEVDVLATIFNKASKQPGIVNMAEPQFYIELIKEDGTEETLYLWLGESGKRSTLMNENDTHTIFLLLEADTEKLIDLFQLS